MLRKLLGNIDSTYPLSYADKVKYARSLFKIDPDIMADRLSFKTILIKDPENPKKISRYQYQTMLLSEKMAA